MTYSWRKILPEILLDWSQTFGSVNPQTFGQATGVVIDNLGLIAWAYYPLNMNEYGTSVPPISVSLRLALRAGDMCSSSGV